MTNGGTKNCRLHILFLLSWIGITACGTPSATVTERSSAEQQVTSAPYAIASPLLLTLHRRFRHHGSIVEDRVEYFEDYTRCSRRVTFSWYRVQVSLDARYDSTADKHWMVIGPPIGPDRVNGFIKTLRKSGEKRFGSVSFRASTANGERLYVKDHERAIATWISRTLDSNCLRRNQTNQ